MYLSVVTKQCMFLPQLLHRNGTTRYNIIHQNLKKGTRKILLFHFIVAYLTAIHSPDILSQIHEEDFRPSVSLLLCLFFNETK
jgi:uncharacterized sodium:solute symporter family permease YidK